MPRDFCSAQILGVLLFLSLANAQTNPVLTLPRFAVFPLTKSQDRFIRDVADFVAGMNIDLHRSGKVSGS